jgi:hypothetical protein
VRHPGALSAVMVVTAMQFWDPVASTEQAEFGDGLFGEFRFHSYRDRMDGPLM